MKRKPVPAYRAEDIRISMQNEKFAEWIDLVGVQGAEIYLAKWREYLVWTETASYRLAVPYGTAEECEEFARFLDRCIKTNNTGNE